VRLVCYARNPYLPLDVLLRQFRYDLVRRVLVLRDPLEVLEELTRSVRPFRRRFVTPFVAASVGARPPSPASHDFTRADVSFNPSSASVVSDSGQDDVIRILRRV
jgi:hypothetical protein